MAKVEVRDGAIGEPGVFTLEAVAEGEVVREFVLAREITPEAPLREGERPEHCPVIDGRRYWIAPPDCYFNHGCDPNVYLRHGAERIDVVARRAIPGGSELLLDYLINNSGGDSWICRCGADRCRGKTGVSFFTLPPELQREYLPLLAPWFVRRHAEAVARLKREVEDTDQ